MFKFDWPVRVRYAETDKMGYAYYGNYATYLEVARVEALRSIGISYKELEDEGVMLPVAEFYIKYFKPAYYDEELLTRVTIKKKPGIKIEFEYEMFNKEGTQINFAKTTLVFVSVKTGKPMKPPVKVVQAFDRFFTPKN